MLTYLLCTDEPARAHAHTWRPHGVMKPRFFCARKETKGAQGRWRGGLELNLRAVHQPLRAFRRLPDYFHIKHRSLQAPQRSLFFGRTDNAITHPPHPLPGRASKRAGAGPQNGRIPHILSNWVAAFEAAHRMWETGDKRLPFTTLPPFPTHTSSLLRCSSSSSSPLRPRFPRSLLVGSAPLLLPLPLPLDQVLFSFQISCSFVNNNNADMLRAPPPSPTHHQHTV